jgi:hypothetical protein
MGRKRLQAPGGGMNADHDQFRAFLRHRRPTLVRLRRVNKALRRWDEIQ